MTRLTPEREKQIRETCARVHSESIQWTTKALDYVAHEAIDPQCAAIDVLTRIQSKWKSPQTMPSLICSIM